MPNSSVKKLNTKGRKTPNRADNSSSSSSSSTPSSVSRSRKKRRIDKDARRRHSLDSDIGDYNADDAKEIDRRLRKVALKNAISTEDMQKVVRSVVRNDHVLALVTLRAEDELAREREEAEQRAIIITETPSVAKLTRAKARELNCTPGISLPSLSETPEKNEIEALIREDLHSDEDDEEYTLKEDDFHSDEDPNTTASDFDSNPCTPQTPLTTTEAEDSPVKFSSDGCFKVPFDKKGTEDLRIATRTRSKLCLQQTTIEDIQSEFVPPDVEQNEIHEYDMTANDADWMQFLNDFSKPLNNTYVGDDDDPVNDPEYIGAEKVPVDAEELRDVNISKKELTDLVSELFAGLLQEGVSLDSVELETPHKFLYYNENDALIESPKELANVQKKPIDLVTRQIDFDCQPVISGGIEMETVEAGNTTLTQMTSFHPSVMSTPSAAVYHSMVSMPIAESRNMNSTTNTIITDTPCKMVGVPVTALTQQPELIAVPLPGQPNCFQLAKVIPSGPAADNQYKQVVSAEQSQYIAPMAAVAGESQDESTTVVLEPSEMSQRAENRYTVPFDTNFTWEYISIRKHIYSEYTEHFENLRTMKPPETEIESAAKGFTQEQHEMLQQQLRIHTQMLTQTFLQTYSHPVLYAAAKQPRDMLFELHKKAAKDASFNCWNLNKAIALICKWENDLSSNEYDVENKKMMEFIYKEIELTDGRTRQIPRMAPRIMDLMLSSTVFMYPQYLPRIAFQPRNLQVSVFAPSEYQLIAIGLEKHLNAVKNSKLSLRKTANPVRISCKRMAKDTVYGKLGQRIFKKVKELRDMDQYNPVQYFFDKGRAPPVDRTIYGFENGVVFPPRERYHELPSGWKYYIEKTWTKKRVRRPKELTKVSELASTSYLKFVREAIGEDLLLPENFADASAPHGSSTGLETTYASLTKEVTQSIKQFVKIELGKKRNRRKKRNNISQSPSLTINVNYVFGGDATSDIHGAGISVPFQDGTLAAHIDVINRTLLTSSDSNLLALPPSLPPLSVDTVPVINYSYDHMTQSLEITELDQFAEQDQITQISGTETTATQQTSRTSECTKSVCSTKKPRFRIFKLNHWQGRHSKHRNTQLKSSVSPHSYRFHTLRQALRKKLKKRCQRLISSYGNYLNRQRNRFAHSESVQFYYKRFLALELYTQLLADLSMFCRTKTQVAARVTSPSSSNAAAHQHQQQQKRQRNTASNISSNLSNSTDDESFTASVRNRRAHRQEEMLRHMLQPDTPVERNRKDATFAYNFYDKVEDALISANRVDDCQIFNQLLRSFNPKQDKVSDLYVKIEKLLMPDNPELAEIFLNFLLPAEAAEMGKFFEHFMITNATSFINKLNVYFCKQPAQIRKIYACLSELAELPNVSMKKVESKIMPLLKGNQFLCDWFLQQFPQARPPERLLPVPETINLYEVQHNTSGEFTETISDLLESPTKEESSGCQLKYMNGRIFYGGKILLPAKLSFMATSIYNEQNTDDNVVGSNSFNCAHGVRAHGEKLISATAGTDSDDNERFEEEEAGRTLMVDTTADEENSCSLIEMCDDMALRAHAVRLNPGYYSSNSMGHSATSAPNVTGTHHSHHSNAKKLSINFGETSPRKQSSLTNSPMSGISPLLPLSSTATGGQMPQDKRKSPTKKLRSPLGQTSTKARYNFPPMVVIHDHQMPRNVPSTSTAIECAKRLKTLIDQESARQDVNNKVNVNIIAKVKQKIVTKPSEETDQISKNEQMSDQMHVPLPHEQFPDIKMDVEPSEEGDEPLLVVSAGSTPQHVITQFDSDEDCKLDVVASLVNVESQTESSVTQTEDTIIQKPPTTDDSAITPCQQSNILSGNSTAWTRDEDKVILIEMKKGARGRDDLIQRIGAKLTHRNEKELRARHQFLIDFLSKLQGKI